MGASKAGTMIRSSIHHKSSLMKWIIYGSHVSEPLNTTCLSKIKHSKVFGELIGIIFSCVHAYWYCRVIASGLQILVLGPLNIPEELAQEPAQSTYSVAPRRNFERMQNLRI